MLLELELPARELIEAEIASLNQGLEVFAFEATTQGLTSINPGSFPASDDQDTKIAVGTTPAAFWCHHIEGPLVVVGAEMYFLAETGRADAEVVSSIQGRLYRLVNDWMNHPIESIDVLNRETSGAFLEAAFSFDWMKSPTLTRRLVNQMGDISDFYMMREGRMPHDFFGMIEGRKKPSRAYLKCSNS